MRTMSLRLIRLCLAILLLPAGPAIAQICADSHIYSASHACTWANAVHEHLPAAPYTVVPTAVPGDGYSRFRVVLGNGGREIAVHTSKRDSANSRNATDYAIRVGLAYAQLPPWLQWTLPDGVAISDGPTGGYFPRYCPLDLGHNKCGEQSTSRARHMIALPAEYYERPGALTAEFEELLLHEIGHVFYYTGWFDATAWAAATTSDESAYVSEYARTHEAEDFAESFCAWVLWRSYSRGLSSAAIQNIERIGNRLAYFDGQLTEAVLNQR